MFGEDIVENGYEARIALEGARRRWYNCGGANGQGGVWGRRVQIGQQIAIRLLGVSEDFLRKIN